MVGRFPFSAHCLQNAGNLTIVVTVSERSKIKGNRVTDYIEMRRGSDHGEKWDGGEERQGKKAKDYSYAGPVYYVLTYKKGKNTPVLSKCPPEGSTTSG